MDKICQNCKNWDWGGFMESHPIYGDACDDRKGKEDAWKDYGRCKLSLDVSDEWDGVIDTDEDHIKISKINSPIISTDNEGYASQIGFRFDFGCKRWEAK